MNRYMTFLKVLETGSFSKTAEELGYTESVVSQMIVSLEKELSTTLLVRSRRGIRLTSDGQELLPYINNVCSSYYELKEKVSALHGLKPAVIRIGTFSSISCYWLPGLIKEFNTVPSASPTGTKIICRLLPRLS